MHINVHLTKLRVFFLLVMICLYGRYQMRYEKANAEVHQFGKASFLMQSSGVTEEQAKAAAESAALSAYGGGNPKIQSSDATQINGVWYVDVVVSNHGNQHRKRYMYDASTGTISEIPL